MNETEFATFMARVGALSGRLFDELAISAWYDVIGEHTYEDAVRALNRHFRNSDEYLQPVHIIRGIRAHREETGYRKPAPAGKRWAIDVIEAAIAEDEALARSGGSEG